MSFWGLTVNPAEAIEPDTPNGVTSTKYPPPVISGVVKVVEIIPLPSDPTERTPKPVQLPDAVLKHIVYVMLGVK
jgi:hypothetical protein